MNNEAYEKWLFTAFLTSVGVLFFLFFALPLIINFSPLFTVLSTLNGTAKIFIVTVPHQLLMLICVPALSLFIKTNQSLPELLNLRNWRFLYLLYVPAIEFFLFPAVALSIFVFTILLSSLGFKPDTPILFKIIQSCSTEGFILIAISAVIIAPLSEEIIFRHIIFNYLKSKMSTPLALVTSALLFASIHMNLPQLPGLFMLGVVLQLLYIHFKSLYPCILLHILQNSIALLILLLVKSFNLIQPA